MAQALWKKVISFKTKHGLIRGYSKCIFQDINPKEMKIYVHANMCPPMFIFFNNQTLATTQMSFRGLMVKRTVVHLYYGILLSNKQLEWISRELCWMKKKSISKCFFLSVRYLPKQKIQKYFLYSLRKMGHWYV